MNNNRPHQIFKNLSEKLVIKFHWPYGVQRCQITEVVFYTKVLVNDILAGLERILDYAGVRLERFSCIF